MNLKLKLLTGAALVGLSALAVPSTAQATAFATTAALVTNASFGGAGFTGFDTFGPFILRTTSTTLDGNTVNTSLISVTGAGASLDQPLNCQGNCAGFTNNSFFTGDASAPQFAVADSHELNTVISAGTATWGSRTSAKVEGDHGGSASTGSSNELDWNFTSPGGIVSLHLDTQLLAFLSTTVQGESADGTLNIAVSISGAGGPTTVASFNDFISDIDAPGTRGNPSVVSGSFDFSTSVSAGAHTLRIVFDSAADASSIAVPEPATLSLFGLGLLGAGFVSRRRRAKA